MTSLARRRLLHRRTAISFAWTSIRAGATRHVDDRPDRRTRASRGAHDGSSSGLPRGCRPRRGCPRQPRNDRTSRGGPCPRSPGTGGDPRPDRRAACAARRVSSRDPGPGDGRGPRRRRRARAYRGPARSSPPPARGPGRRGEPPRCRSRGGGACRPALQVRALVERSRVALQAGDLGARRRRRPAKPARRPSRMAIRTVRASPSAWSGWWPRRAAIWRPPVSRSSEVRALAADDPDPTAAIAADHGPGHRPWPTPASWMPPSRLGRAPSTSAGGSATVTSRPPSRTTWPTCSTRPVASRMRWSISSARSRCSPRSASAGPERGSRDLGAGRLVGASRRPGDSVSSAFRPCCSGRSRW